MYLNICFNPLRLLFCQSKFHKHRSLVTIPCILQAALMLGATSAQAEPNLNTLTVAATGFKNDNGHAIAKLFIPGDNVLKKGRQELIVVIRGGQVSITFDALPAGDYAVVVFHDENENGAIDHNLLGLPSESLGFSNGFILSLISGLPSFEKLQFTHGITAQTILVKVN